MKKRIMTILLAGLLCAGALAGCGSKEPNNSSTDGADVSSESASSLPDASQSEATDGSIESVVHAITAAVPIAMPAEVDDAMLSDLFYISADDAEEYYGEFAMAMISCDTVIGVKPVAGKKQVVIDGFQKRIADKEAEFENYLPDQYEKAKKARIVEKGEYVFLLILGESMETFDADLAKAEDIINSAF